LEGCLDGFRILASNQGAAARVAVFGEVDAATAPELADAIGLAADTECVEVVIDCRGLTFIDSSGLSVLVAGHKHLRGTDRLLVIEFPPAPARRLFHISGLDKVLTIRE
jgi:anti-anti-sigma factor